MAHSLTLMTCELSRITDILARAAESEFLDEGPRKHFRFRCAILSCELLLTFPWHGSKSNTWELIATGSTSGHIRLELGLKLNGTSNCQ